MVDAGLRGRLEPCLGQQATHRGLLVRVIKAIDRVSQCHMPLGFGNQEVISLLVIH